MVCGRSFLISAYRPYGFGNTRYSFQTVVKEHAKIFDGELFIVENTGLEPVTSALQGRRSPS